MTVYLKTKQNKIYKKAHVDDVDVDDKTIDVYMTSGYIYSIPKSCIKRVYTGYIINKDYETIYEIYPGDMLIK